MNLKEQIQEGQHRANQIIKQIKRDIKDLDKNTIALSTFKEELESEILELFNKK